MAGEPMSFVKAVKLFFEGDPYGRKVEIAEFQALTDNDREDLRGLLLGEGYNVRPFGAAA